MVFWDCLWMIGLLYFLQSYWIRQSQSHKTVFAFGGLLTKYEYFHGSRSLSQAFSLQYFSGYPLSNSGSLTSSVLPIPALKWLLPHAEWSRPRSGGTMRPPRWMNTEEKAEWGTHQQCNNNYPLWTETLTSICPAYQCAPIVLRGRGRRGK